MPIASDNREAFANHSGSKHSPFGRFDTYSEQVNPRITGQCSTATLLSELRGRFSISLRIIQVGTQIPVLDVAALAPASQLPCQPYEAKENIRSRGPGSEVCLVAVT
jgi:hypothetical protein